MTNRGLPCRPETLLLDTGTNGGSTGPVVRDVIRTCILPYQVLAVSIIYFDPSDLLSFIPETKYYEVMTKNLHCLLCEN